MPADRKAAAMTTVEIITAAGIDEFTACDWPVDQRPALVYVYGLSSVNSQRTIRHALDRMAAILTGEACNCETCPWHLLRYQHTTKLRAELARLYAPATANLMLSALRGVLRACWRLGQMTNEELARVMDLEAVRGTTLPRGRALSARELLALFEACADDPTAAGRRDAAILAVMRQGLRRAEVAALELADWNPETTGLLVHGKGNKERMAYIKGAGLEAMEDWLVLRGEAPGRLFWPIGKNRRPQPGSLTDQAIYDMCKKRGQRARIKDFSPHDLRRTCIGDMLDAGNDLPTVAAYVGHSNVNTTGRYDRRGERAKERAAASINTPYVRPNTLLVE